MESEEDDYQRNSQFGRIISQINKMLKKPTLDSDLNQCLDQFLSQLSASQEYLSNGIFTIKFSEAALFLQSSAELYSKKVDLLWDNLVDYHLNLCSYNKPDQDSTCKEKAKILDRMKKSKRKKVIENDLELQQALAKANQVEPKESKTETNENEKEPAKENDTEMELDKPIKQNESGDGDNTYLEVFKSTSSPIYNEDGEKMSNLSELYLNKNVPSYAFDDVRFQNSTTLQNLDLSLYTYLQENNIDYFDYCKNQLCGKHEECPTGQVSDKLMKECNICDSKDAVRRNSDVDSAFDDTELAHTDLEKGSTDNPDSTQRLSTTAFESNELECINLESRYDENLVDTAQRLSSIDSGFFDLQLDSSNLVNNTENSEQVIEVSNTNNTENSEQVIEVSNTNSAVPTNSFSKSQCFVEAIESSNGQKELKRKLSEDENIPHIKKRKKSRNSSKLLKTTVTTLKKFEQFFRQHYVPDPAEGVPLLLSDEESDDEDSSCQNNLEDNIYLENSEAACTDEIETDQSRTHLENSEIHSVREDSRSSTDASHVVDNSDNDSESPHVPDKSLIEEFQDLYPKSMSTPKRIFDIHLRVLQWKKFIEPKLKTLGNNSDFDIHEYGTRIMDAIPKDGALNFATLSKEKSSGEVCRLFMASLQLANTANVEFINPVSGQLCNNKLELKLLTRDRYHEHLHEYEAPSENSYREKLTRINLPSTSKQPDAYRGHMKTTLRKRRLF